MQFGIYSFGDIHQDPLSGERVSVEQNLADTIERIKLADDTGLDYFGLGEHHRPDYSISAPATVLAAASTVTSRIKLGSAVTVLSTEDPVRVFQQFATIDLLSHGRAEIVAGRGSFIESFPIFGASLDDYDALYAEKLDLLLALNDFEFITWSGRFRAPLESQQILPRPSQHGDYPGKLDMWIATGGNPESSARAVEQRSEAFDLYRRSAAQHGHDPATLRTAVAAPGFVGTDGRATKDAFFPYWIDSMERISAERGFPAPTRETYEDMVDARGAIFAGDPDEVAAKIVAVHGHLGMDRIGLQMDWSGVPQEMVLESIGLFATEVAPRVRKALAEA
jgi:alkanesulfonate monooxygenase SsuD/methylene tetrahydromethanopterin reductase-like flavin-dependent oxidoreductase (luciferase family)